MTPRCSDFPYNAPLWFLLLILLLPTAIISTL